MDRPWLKSYPPGTPAEIDLSKQETIVDVFDQSCKKYGDAPAFFNMGKWITYAELDRLSAQFASYHQHQSGLLPGDRIA